MSDYVVVGKFSQINIEEIFSEKIIERVERSVSSKFNSKIVRSVIAAGIAIAIGAILQDTTFAAEIHNTFAGYDQAAVEVMARPNGSGYSEPTQLHAILKFIDWLIFMVRWIVSSIIGLICSYAGHKWATDISGNGVAEAKKILKNCAVGVFWVQFGATIGNYFVDKLASFA